jgi:hypothetical protein
MNKLLHKLLHILLVFLHVSLILIFVIGPFLTGKYLIYYLFLWPAIYFHWYFNDNKCMITEIEYNIDKNFFSNIDEYRHYSKSKFFSILNKVNIIFTNFDSFDNFLNYYRSILWIIVFIKALIYYRKDIAKDWVSIKKHIVLRFICDSCKR